jgi:predicted CopG family antitoxin
MKTIYINDKARVALERHALSGRFSLGTCKAVTRDVWEVAVEDDVYTLLQKMSQ